MRDKQITLLRNILRVINSSDKDDYTKLIEIEDMIYRIGIYYRD